MYNVGDVIKTRRGNTLRILELLPNCGCGYYYCERIDKPGVKYNIPFEFEKYKKKIV